MAEYRVRGVEGGAVIVSAVSVREAAEKSKGMLGRGVKWVEVIETEEEE